ncbi:MAG: protoporphyrinogen oxidase [Nitrosomonadales bacterium]|nr:protoporphyrinogen oxidase [Nitrosomonadales bacterium]
MHDIDALIIGGGISGLSTAWWLAQSGLSVEVWEAAARPGGKIQSEQRDGYLTEQTASLLLNFRPEVADMVHLAGLEAKKAARTTAAEANRYLVHQGRLVSLPMRLGGLVRSPLWSGRGKLRLLLEPFIPAGEHEGETVSEFITRRLGREMLDKVMDAFVAGILAADPDYANAAATLPRLTALERCYGSLTAGVFMHRVLRRRTACRAETFSFQGGMGTLIDTLSSSPGVHLRSQHAVADLAPARRGWRVSATTPLGGRSVTARHVVVSTPASAAARLIAPLDQNIAGLLQTIRYAPLAVVHLGMDRSGVGHPLDGAGFLVPGCEGLPLNGNQWMSTLFGDRAPAGKVLLTSYLGGARRPEAVEWSNERLVDETLAALRPLIGVGADPEMVRIHRHHEGLPLYYGAHPALEREIAATARRHPGLHLEANYLGGVSVRDRIARGRALARRILMQERDVSAVYPAVASPLIAGL